MSSRQDAITEEEINGTAPSLPEAEAKDGTPSPPRKKPKNAFTELMSTPSKRTYKAATPVSGSTRSTINPHPNRTNPDPLTGVSLNNLHGRDGLGPYIVKPEAFPSPQRVLRFDDNFVVVHDLYPKATIHMLLLPRDSTMSALHPFDALANEAFLATVRAEAAKVTKVVADELRRLFGKYSKADAARNEALAAADPPRELPPGRDWQREVAVGVHAHPSMNHMHIHIMSQDRHSECLKHRKHYNSFSTAFFVPLKDFPLAEDDERRYPGRAGYLERDLICWRCGGNFGNKFKALKSHLHSEFEEWKTA